MMTYFGALPDTHLLAGLCEPDRKEEHFSAAMKRGVPLFADGVRALAKHAAAALTPVLRETRRTLVTEPALTVIVAREPVLDVSEGRFATASLQWSALEARRELVEAALPAVGPLFPDSGKERRPAGTGFLIGPRQVLTANQVLDRLEKSGASSFWFSNAENPLDSGAAAHRIERVIWIDAEARLALLELRDAVENAAPLRFPEVGPPPEKTMTRPDVVLIGYPNSSESGDDKIASHAFGKSAWKKLVQPGHIIAAPPSAGGAITPPSSSAGVQAHRFWGLRAASY